MKKISLAFTHNERKRCGINLLHGIKPEITALSKTAVTYEISGDFSAEVLDKLTDTQSIKHVDFRGVPFCLIYDLKKVITADRIMVSSFNEIWHYIVKEFEVYISETREDLYSPSHKVGFNISEKMQRYGHYTCGDWIFKITGIPFRYFGFKAIKACVADEICRVRGLYIFDDKIDNCNFYVKRSFPENLLSGAKVSATGSFSGNLNSLTDEKVFDTGVTVKGNARFIIETADKNMDKVSLIGKSLANLSVSVGNRQSELFASAFPVQTVSPLLYGRSLASVQLPAGKYKYIGIISHGECELEEVCVESNKREIVINTEKVLNPDFMGIGSNCIATYLSKNSIDSGYSKPLFELEKRRFKQLQPHVNRIFVQLDWIVETEEDYLSGNYNFHTSDFESLSQTIAAFNEIGAEVEFDWGWKTADRQQVWNSFKECREKSLATARDSAPRDIVSYAKAGAAAINELYVNRGLHNIKYISLFNEVAYCTDTAGDFAYPKEGEEKLKYWCELLRNLNSELVAFGIADKFKYWAAEQAGYDIGLVDGTMNYMNKLIPDLLDTHCVHMYNFNYDDLSEAFSGPIAKAKGGKPVMVTEFSNSSATDVSYERNHVNTMISMARNGISGGCLWILSGAYLPDPMNWVHDGAVPGDSDCASTFWQFLGTDLYLEQVGESFYELSLFGNYVPNHSSVVESFTNSPISDTRFAAFKHNDDITVVVESRADSDVKQLEIKFANPINRKFYKYRYSRPNKREANLIIPPCCGTIVADGSISDTLEQQYSLTVYSTIPPVKQVVMGNVCVYAEPGTSVKLSASVIDSAESQLIWSICSATTENATVTSDGVFTLPAQSALDDTFAVKAALPTGEYGITIIRVKPW